MDVARMPRRGARPGPVGAPVNGERDGSAGRSGSCRLRDRTKKNSASRQTTQLPRTLPVTYVPTIKLTQNSTMRSRNTESPFTHAWKARGPAGQAVATRSGLVSQSDADSERTAPPGHGAQAVEAQPGLDRTAVNEEMRSRDRPSMSHERRGQQATSKSRLQTALVVAARIDLLSGLN
jgi:hypothetical protein